MTPTHVFQGRGKGLPCFPTTFKLIQLSLCETCRNHQKCPSLSKTEGETTLSGPAQFFQVTFYPLFPMPSNLSLKPNRSHVGIENVSSSFNVEYLSFNRPSKTTTLGTPETYILYFLPRILVHFL